MYFTIEKIAKQLPELRVAIRRETRPIQTFRFHEGDCAGAQAVQYDDRAWREFRTGETWGGYDVLAWFRARVPIPPEWKFGKVALRLLVGPRDGGGSTAESLLYVNGVPLQGIDLWHEEAWLPREFLQDSEIRIAIKAWSGVIDTPEVRRFKTAELVRIDEPTECFYYLADTLLNAVRALEENDLRRLKLLQTLDEAFACLDYSQPGSEAFYHSVQAAGQLLEKRVHDLNSNHELKPTVVGIGHSHLDMAWLWRLRHTREKAARTFSTALHLMRQYPEYRFLHSSPQLYEYLKRDHPEIIEQVRDRIAAGQWEITGGMWVEPDTNIPGGESLVRQVLYGKRYLQNEFGVDSKILWMPDVFGFSYALPQIMLKSGLKYLLTTKLSWNQYNRFPYDTFLWRGLDGSEVLTHFVTTPEENSNHHSYMAKLEPAEIKGLWANYQQKDINDELLLLYGWGDGGGGPTQEMLEAARVMNNLPGLPRVQLGRAEPYFERLGQRLAGKPLPTWDGELYLEYHRGTYTSQAFNKRANRKSEALYHDAEWLAALADILTARDNYPRAQLREGWQLLLLNQFHDILPGSSTRQVYEDSRADYELIQSLGQASCDRARQAILPEVCAPRDSLVAFNSLGTARSEIVELPWVPEIAGKTIAGADGQPSPVQVVGGEGNASLLFEANDVPPLGYRAFPLVEKSGQVPNELLVTPRHLQNAFYDIELNSKGQIVSLYDRTNERQALAPGARGNVLQAFEDKPMAFDAWDIDIYYRDKMVELGDLREAVVEEQGPLRGVLRLTWKFNDSTITQRLTIYRRSRRIDFKTAVDWRESQVLLKVAFPVDIRATHAAYDIQFGSIERPNHWNTSWDYARFEVCAHKWADLSEGNYGVALLNDCKYGYDVKDNQLRLTLLKSAVRPDASADKGAHTFTYSLLPHAGGWREGDVVPAAYALNYPLQHYLIPARPSGSLPAHFSLVSVDADNAVLDTVKRAEDERAYIVRLFECKQERRGRVTLRFGCPITRAVECNLLEADERPVEFAPDSVSFPLAPYELKSIKVWFEGEAG